MKIISNIPFLFLIVLSGCSTQHDLSGSWVGHFNRPLSSELEMDVHAELNRVFLKLNPDHSFLMKLEGIPYQGSYEYKKGSLLLQSKKIFSKITDQRKFILVHNKETELIFSHQLLGKIKLKKCKL